MEHYPLMALVIGWTCVGVFVATAALTIFDLAAVRKLPPEIAKILHKVLIVEVVIIGVGLFANVMQLSPWQAKADIAQNAKQTVIEEQVRPLEAKVDQLQTPVFVHIADEAQRPIANRVRDRLVEQGFNVRGIENVGTKGSPNVSDVRYYTGNQQISEYAQSISKAMTDAGLSNVRISPSPNKAFGENIEIWFPAKLETNL